MVVANPVAEFEKLTKPPFDDQNDPFGWRTLERLGLSLSCRFRDSEGEGIGPEQLQDVRNIICKQLNSKNYPVSLMTFIAGSGDTLLYGIRLVYSNPERWILLYPDHPEENSYYFAESLGALSAYNDWTLTKG